MSTSASEPVTTAANSASVEAATHTARARALRVGAAALGVVGVVVILFCHWLMTSTTVVSVEQRGISEVERMVQWLVTGNLTVFLAWVWFDRRMPCRNQEDTDARYALWFVAAFVAGINTLGGAAWAGVLNWEPFLPFLLCITAPLLLTVVPFLWLATRRIERPWLNAVVLAGMVFASAIVQNTYAIGRNAELRLFTMNSCLIGLATAIWLVTWAATPARRRTP